MIDLSNENVIHVKKGDIQYLQFKRFLKYSDKLQHCFTMKNLDFRNKKRDDQNYQIICRELNIDVQNIVRPQQAHTNIVEHVDYQNKSNTFSNVDGLITNLKDTALSLVFADCTALLLYDPTKNVIGNIHSGWRGTVSKIGKTAINKMIEEHNCNPDDIICCIGPTIRKCHFRVHADVKEKFEKVFGKSIIAPAGMQDGEETFMVDVVGANIKMLKECGLRDENIIDSGICTVCNNELFHSYRAHKDLSGRNTAIMCLI